MITFLFTIYRTCIDIKDNKPLDGDKYFNYVLAILIETLIIIVFGICYKLLKILIL